MAVPLTARLAALNSLINKKGAAIDSAKVMQVSKMIRLLLIIMFLKLITTSIPSKNVANSKPEDNSYIKQVSVEANNANGSTLTTITPYISTLSSATSSLVPTTTSSSAAAATTSTTTTSANNPDPNADPDDSYQTTASGSDNSTNNPVDNTDTNSNGTNSNPDNNTDKKINPNQTKPKNPNKPGEQDNSGEQQSYEKRTNVELSVLFYSTFIVYVSFIKLLHHNVRFIQRYLSEPGILIISGIIWELLVKRINVGGHDVFPRFNYRIFFYLFLPSTILESASLLSNKWLFLNLLPILIHAIVGTLLFASSLGFTIHFLGSQDVFNFNVLPSQSFVGDPTGSQTNQTPGRATSRAGEASLARQNLALDQWQSFGSNNLQASERQTIVQNLSLSDCLLFSTVVSSIDSTIMQNVLKSHQINEKLYYLVIGESLLNNAVVLVLFELLLDFFNATRLTVVRVYITIIQFFTTLIGSVFIGLLLASVALVAVRLTRRFQVIPSVMTSYQHQCQAMVETLLILKLAYLTYNLASLASTSSILSLVTFAIFEDQYIKQNLNLRSQLTYRQVILATKTMGYSLVYPLIGMLLVEVASKGHLFIGWFPMSEATTTMTTAAALTINSASDSIINSSDALVLSSSSFASSKLNHLAHQASLHWNFKFLSIVLILTFIYRFVIVIVMALLSNLLSGGQLRIRFREQILLAYGGLKGPIAVALVQKLFEHHEFKDKTIGNRHLFTYTILFIVFISTVITGALIRPLVAKIQSNLIKQTTSTSAPSASKGDKVDYLESDATGNELGGANDKARLQTIVFDEINHKLCEHITRAINSILGHNSSCYDRFIEFNEIHIKPKLTRKECNINWLSTFYDNLVLNETLNANHFHAPSEEAPVAPIRSSETGEGPSRPVEAPSRRYRRQGASLGQLPLATIDELSMVTTSKQPAILDELGPEFWHISRRSGPRDRRPASDAKFKNILPPNSGGPAESTLIREYVMLQLRLEEQERQRKLLASSKLANHERPTTSSARDMGEVRMLSTSSDDVDRSATAPDPTKDDYLMALDRKMSQMRDEPGPSRKSLHSSRTYSRSKRVRVRHKRADESGHTLAR